MTTKLEAAKSAAPWKSPSAEHPLGTILVAAIGHGPVLYEIDAATGKRLAAVSLDPKLTAHDVRVAATARGAVVVSGGSDEDAAPARIWILDRKLAVRKIIDTKRDGIDANVHAEEGTAVVTYRFYQTIRGVDSARQAVVTLGVPSGARLGQSVFAEGPTPPRIGPLEQAVVSGGRVYTLVRGKHIDVFAHSLDLRRLFGRYHRTMPEHFELEGTARLVADRGSVLVAGKGWLSRLGRNGLKAKKLEAWPIEPLAHDHELVATGSVHAESGELLLDTGYVATSVLSKPERVVRFGRETFCPFDSCESSKRPYYEDEPIAAFWLGQRGVIVTRGRQLGVTVIGN